MSVEVRFHVSDAVRAKCHQVAALTRQPPKEVYAAWLEYMVSMFDENQLVSVLMEFEAAAGVFYAHNPKPQPRKEGS
jgi:hypothetical protein